MELLITVAILVLAILGAPLFAIFGGASMALFASMEGGSPDWPANEVFTERFSENNLMVTIPLFIFTGYILAESGTPRRLVNLSRAWLGWLPGGLAIVCIFASAFFTTFTGGSGITIVAIGGLLFPALMAEKYPEKFGLGLVTTGGSLGLLFPPSLPLILYGIVAEVTIEKLFLAGFIPGVLTLGVLAMYSIFVGVREKMPRVAFDFRVAILATWEALAELLLPVVIVGGLMFDIMRIHEAAAFAAIYSLIIEVFVYRDVSIRRDLPRIIRSAVTMLGAILIILAAAIGFTGYLIQAGVPERILNMMLEYISDPIVFLLLLNVFLLLVGMLMDIFSAIVVVVPLVVPIATDPAIGIDPYHLGIIFLLNLEIGYLTPPVGMNLFMSSLRFDKPVTVLYRAVLPFIALLVVALVATTYIESLTVTMTGFADTDEMPDMEQEPLDDEGLDDGGGTLDDLGGGTLDDLGDEDFNLDDLDDDDGELNLDDLGDDVEPGDEGFNLDDLGADTEPAADEDAEGGAEPADDGVFTLDDL